MSVSARRTRTFRTRKAVAAALTAAVAGSILVTASPASAAEAYKQFTLSWTQADGKETVSISLTKSSSLDGHVFVTQSRKNDKGTTRRTASVSLSLPLSALTFDGKKVSLDTGNKLGDAGKIDVVYTAGDNSTSSCGGNITTIALSKTKVDAFNVKGLGVAINKAPAKAKRVVYNGKVQQNPGKFCPGWDPGPGSDACDNETAGFFAAKGMQLGVSASRERYYSKAANAYKERSIVGGSNFGTLKLMNNAPLFQSVSSTMGAAKIVATENDVTVTGGAPFVTGSAKASREGEWSWSNPTACKERGESVSERNGSAYGFVSQSSLELDFLVGNQKLTTGTEHQPQAATLQVHEIIRP